MKLMLLMGLTLAMFPLIANASETLPVRLLGEDGRATEPFTVLKIVKTKELWQSRLSADQFKITRGHGTEAAFCGVFHDNHKDGVYACAGCGLPLFRSDAKFDSGTGWPSFFQPFAAENIGETVDRSYGMVRTEIHCARCGAHLGHVFNDGPPPTKLRYCINSGALSFFEKGATGPDAVYFAASSGISGEAGRMEGASVVKRSLEAKELKPVISHALEMKTPAIYFSTPVQEAVIREVVSHSKPTAEVAIELAGPFDSEGAGKQR